ncbi:thiamine-phosphate kinase [Aliifodinibius sp. S!AR15-10]|uniref:thiamine-phosphate kinase n=1 Tax=Aliifodinibius sp. S!AR15-10 TaxID=2950437 RepID=UPI00285BB0E5|nr:thiamine-phosphate kinase [Aliifodinibius sp. S!AR15-10]MDR8390555.1 thiamine-phosphate kinase [Aliifodinibius sp. S!AR15-10]
MDKDSFRSIESIGRYRLIEELSEQTAFRNDKVIKGIGDDSAVIDETQTYAGLLSSESFLEGVNFDLTYTPLHHLGYKIVTAAVSDIYAMNGTPDSVLINLGLPNKLSVDMVNEIYKGVDAASNDYGVEVAGGDLTASHQILSLSITAHGRAEKEYLVYRSGAKIDEAVCVTGDVGGAIAGLRILMREKKFWEEHQQDQFQPDLGDYEYVVKRQLVPVARRDFIDKIAELEMQPGAMIDLTQGLVSDLHQLADASNVGAHIYQAALPIAIETRQVADEMKEDVDKYALYGGEDFELLFTLPKEQVEKLADEFQDFVVIGKITPKEEGVKMQRQDGELISFEEQES